MTLRQRILCRLVLLYAALLAPGLVWPAYLDSPVGVLALVPYLSVYLLHTLGIPGLLEHNGACGWGWCAPSLAGWLLIALLVLGGLFALASLIASLRRKR